MKKLKRYNLEIKESLKYVHKCLAGVSVFSDSADKLIDFNDGIFFTLLPVNIDLKKLYDFGSGGILEQNIIEEIFVLDKKMKGQQIPNIQAEIGELICNLISSSNKLSCLIDDYNSQPDDLRDDELFRVFGIYFANEVYYRFGRTSDSVECIEKSLERSNTFWHSLCMISSADLSDVQEQIITLDIIHEICRKAEMVMVGAYDGEGYVIWEKNKSQ